MHRVGDSFLAQVWAQPDDDAPRHVYADWCLESADEATVARGEFVQLQLLARPTARQRRRMEHLSRVFEGQWLGPLAPMIDRQASVHFHRGFLSACTTSSELVPALASHAAWSTVLHLVTQHPELVVAARSMQELQTRSPAVARAAWRAALPSALAASHLVAEPELLAALADGPSVLARCVSIPPAWREEPWPLSASQWDALGRTSAFPHVEEADFGTSLELVSRIVTAGFPRLRRLCVSELDVDVDAWLSALPQTVERVRFSTSVYALELRRVGEQLAVTLEAVLDEEYTAHEVVSMVNSLATLSRARIASIALETTGTPNDETRRLLSFAE